MPAGVLKHARIGWKVLGAVHEPVRTVDAPAKPLSTPVSLLGAATVPF